MKFSLGPLILIVIILDQSQCYNVLFMLPFCSLSHKNIFDPIAEKLAQKGHQVTIVSPFEANTETKEIKRIHLSKNAAIIQSGSFNFFKGSFNNPMVMISLMDTVCKVRDATFNDSQFRKIWQTPRSANQFDLLVVDSAFNDFSLPLAYHWGIPAIYISPGIMYTPIAWNLNIPYPISYLPTGFSGVSMHMDLLQKITNLLSHCTFSILRTWYYFPNHDRFFQSIYPNIPPLIQLESNVSFMMTHTHPALFPSAPSMPYTTEIACAHCRPSQKLPKELQDYFDDSGESGVIYFSIGTFTRGDTMPDEMKQTLIAGFAQLPQKVLWKFEAHIENLPSNIKLIKWAPQQDVLGHPKLRLFITHGGGLSALEAAFHGCPILGFPLSADQLSNIAYAEAKGFAESLDWKSFTAEQLVDKINIILSNKRYKDSAVYLSRLLEDQPQSSLERAVYWIEYVIRHKGAPHLKSSGGDLNFAQYFLLDVIAVMVLILVVILGSLSFLLRKLFKLTFGKVTKTKKHLE